MSAVSRQVAHNRIVCFVVVVGAVEEHGEAFEPEPKNHSNTGLGLGGDALLLVAASQFARCAGVGLRSFFCEPYGESLAGVVATYRESHHHLPVRVWHRLKEEVG